jgi:hypothetical protein
VYINHTSFLSKFITSSPTAAQERTFLPSSLFSLAQGTHFNLLHFLDPIPINTTLKPSITMQLIHFTAVLALIPALAMAGPVIPQFKEDTATIFKRGIDICPSWQTRKVGNPCTQAPGDNGIHACGEVNPAAIVSFPSRPS